jgi:hypothetical protein
MEEKFNPWEFVSVVEDGIYILQRADEETRQKQLEEYKKERKAQLERQLEELKLLH